MGGRRVVLGQQNDGTYGLRVSAAGVDAFVGDGQGGDFTFNSAWSDIAKLHVVGIATAVANGFGTFTATVTWPDLGYKPFFEVRRLETNVVHDDWWSSVHPSGCHAFIQTPNNQFSFGMDIAVTGIYIIYAIPVPSG